VTDAAVGVLVDLEGILVIRRTVPATRRGRSSSSSTIASWRAGSGMGIAHYGPLKEGTGNPAQAGPNTARRHVFWSGESDRHSTAAPCLKPPSST